MRKVELVMPKALAVSGCMAAAMPQLAFAEGNALNTGDTAWMLISTVLVLIMLLPGLALFYGGLARSKNILSVFTQCLVVGGAIGVLWVLYGYSLAFDTTGMLGGTINWNSIVGGFDKALLAGVGHDSQVGTIPESVFITFQMTFAMLTPALIAGSFAERMKFSAVLLFCLLWFTFVYAPLAHMAWSGAGGLLFDWGILEFAGGTVVHINSGVAGLVTCLVVGRRVGFAQTAMPPHNLVFSLAGACLLWAGWFGFNAGSAAAAGATAGMAMLTTQAAACAGVLGWALVETIQVGKPTALGAVSGALAGLIAITPACGFVGPLGAVVMGLVTGALCFYSVTSLKRLFGYDDSFDAFGLHGVGGIIGSLLTGVFASKLLGGFQDISIASQLWVQFKSVIFTLVYCGIVTFVLLKITALFTNGLRVSKEEEQIGLDLSSHNEQAYN